jgi:hypothetical protein
VDAPDGEEYEFAGDVVIREIDQREWDKWSEELDEMEKKVKRDGAQG